MCILEVCQGNAGGQGRTRVWFGSTPFPPYLAAYMLTNTVRTRSYIGTEYHIRVGFYAEEEKLLSTNNAFFTSILRCGMLAFYQR